MNFFKENRYFKWGFTLFCTFAACIICFNLFFSFNLLSELELFVGVLMPFIIGFALAYILSPIANFFEKKCFLPFFSRCKKKKERLCKGLSVLTAILIAILVIVFLLTLLIPQLIISIVGVVEKIPGYIASVSDELARIFHDNPDFQMILDKAMEEIFNNAQQWVSSVVAALPAMLDTLTSGVMGIIEFFKNFILGIIISFYVLYSRERFIAQAKKLLFAFTPENFSKKFIRLLGETHIVFGGYFTGIIIDSTLVGIICFIGVTLMGMPYTLLISCLVGFFNVIPFLGPFLGGVPSALLILLETPEKTIWFIIFMVVLQQFDGNIMNPKILGGTTGLPTFWVLFSILLGGGLFGFLGMVLAVPVFSVLYTVMARGVNARLLKKNLSVKTTDYLYMQTMDKKTQKTKRKKR